MTRDRDEIRAYVDGELDDVSAARITREAQQDAELAAAIAGEWALRAALGAHFAPILAEPVPERLTAPIEASRKVVSLDEARRRFGWDARTFRWAGPAMAAALILALLVPAMRGGQTETRGGMTFASNDLAQALDDQLASDQRQDSETRILLSFADADGDFCRAFAREDLSGIACRTDAGWHLKVQQKGVDVSTNDYRQANSVDNAIMEAAQAMAASPALNAEAERAARARGWKAE